MVHVLCESDARVWAGRNHSTMTRKRRRHTPDQIIRKLAEGHKQLAAGRSLEEVCRHLEIAESTWHRWLAQYGGMKASDAKRLKELEAENARLRRAVSDLTLDKMILAEASRGNFQAPRAAVPAWIMWLANSACPNDGRAGFSASIDRRSARSRRPWMTKRR